MPTYTFRCPKCDARLSTVMSIREYSAAPPVFVCCSEPMDRFFETVPGLAIHNALAGERHYDGLQATDGTDISTRAKHQAYMKANNLTTADDFSQTWKRRAQERAAVMTGHDTTRHNDIAHAIEKLGG